MFKRILRHHASSDRAVFGMHIITSLRHHDVIGFDHADSLTPGRETDVSAVGGVADDIPR